MTANARLAGAVLGHLTGLGVRQFVVCAGARNAPLVSSLLAAGDSRNDLIYPHFDERSAAFFAMGLAKRSSQAVAVLTTSGTAAAELLPAAIEAYYSGIPLVLVTADRPIAFRGSGAPQAIEQTGLFGPYAEMSLDISSPSDLVAVSQWDRTAPLHLNICLAEPSPEDRNGDWGTIKLPLPVRKIPEAEELVTFCGTADRLLVLLGELPERWRGPVERFLVALGVPIWAEATSGLRESEALAPHLVRSESLVATLRPDRILRLGGVPSLRFWRDLEVLSDLPVFSLLPRPFPGLARKTPFLVSDEFPKVGALTQEGWVEDQTLLHDTRLELALTNHPFSEVAILRELSRQIPSDALVFLGNSLPIREWNLAATLSVPHPVCYASRGANGIDGQIATFLGLSEGVTESWGIFGDLTALYDLNAPALMGAMAPGRRRIVILNNGGGRIFSRLPAMAGLSKTEKVVTENRHARGFGAWAAMWGLDYVQWIAGEPAADPFPAIVGESVVLEICLDDNLSEAFWEERK
ncbi:MAG: 2-succinyl-5-enolpyruvyl-6-hydroxy-3-cyclohexene-1-carboxylic-acid synthase [Verrucomicrobiales bacterium]|nr:2-succinyl-5-enolpyruvyl-6-hydroxy-3-cyclohexene-1-carboxylic-acid synthase [Verrucomicrobiales bacterium]